MNTNEPIWNAENMNRKKGDTDFELCGWCQHRGCGSYRYDCMISGSCSLLKNWKDETQWNTPCQIKGLGKLDLLDLVSSKENEINEAKRAIETAEREIGVLNKLVKKAANKPCHPDSRGCDYFPLKARVRVFLDEPKSGISPRWYIGTVVNGYRSGDGCVSYVLDDLPASKGGWGCGMSVPIVILETEYQYFKKNPAEFEIWLQKCDQEYNGKRLITAAMRKLS